VNDPKIENLLRHDEREPPHVQIDRDRHSAKHWLRPVAVASNEGFSEHELKRVERMVRDRRRETAGGVE
jgi:hypothetical protein